MGKTKGSGTGSIFRSGSGWRGQISIDGARKSVSGRTRKEVADKLAELRHGFNTGTYVPRSDITMREWTEQWLHTKVEPKIKEQSFIRLESSFRVHLYPKLGTVPLQNITKDLLEQTYAEVFHQKGECDGKVYTNKEYSHSTVNALSVQFKKCLQYAVDSGLLKTNPHNGVELHKLRPPKKVDAYTSADQEKIIAYCKKGAKKHRIFYFLISTGLRFGEAAGLTWDDVDLNTGEISITKTAVSIHGSMVIQNMPKTANGIRTIYVGENIIEWLKSWHDEIDQDANYRNLVFPNLRMNITNQANAIKTWQDACKEIGIEYRGMHALRHSWATRALEKEIDVKTVSKMLGHKNVITTMNIYQDVLAKQKAKCANIMNDLF